MGEAKFSPGGSSRGTLGVHLQTKPVPKGGVTPQSSAYAPSSIFRKVRPWPHWCLLLMGLGAGGHLCKGWRVSQRPSSATESRAAVCSSSSQASSASGDNGVFLGSKWLTMSVLERRYRRSRMMTWSLDRANRQGVTRYVVGLRLPPTFSLLALHGCGTQAPHRGPQSGSPRKNW